MSEGKRIYDPNEAALLFMGTQGKLVLSSSLSNLIMYLMLTEDKQDVSGSIVTYDGLTESRGFERYFRQDPSDRINTARQLGKFIRQSGPIFQYDITLKDSNSENKFYNEFLPGNPKEFLDFRMAIYNCAMRRAKGNGNKIIFGVMHNGEPDTDRDVLPIHFHFLGTNA